MAFFEISLFLTPKLWRVFELIFWHFLSTKLTKITNVPASNSDVNSLFTTSHKSAPACGGLPFATLAVAPSLLRNSHAEYYYFCLWRGDWWWGKGKTLLNLFDNPFIYLQRNAIMADILFEFSDTFPPENVHCALILYAGSAILTYSYSDYWLYLLSIYPVFFLRIFLST